MCNLVCKSYVTTIHVCKWYVMIHICNFDIEALFKTYVIHMPHLYILKGNAVLASQMEPLRSICKGYVMGPFFVSKNKNSFNIVST